MNEAIIDALHRRPDEDFDSFCEALIETKQNHIVNYYLRPDGQRDIAPQGQLHVAVTQLLISVNLHFISTMVLC